VKEILAHSCWGADTTVKDNLFRMPKLLQSVFPTYTCSSAMMGHLSSKISSIEGRLDSNEKATTRNQEQMNVSGFVEADD
jgi:hypothetical protein